MVCSIEEDSLLILDHMTKFGSWIDFYLFMTSKSSTNQHAYILPQIILCMFRRLVVELCDQEEIIYITTFKQIAWLTQPNSHMWKLALWQSKDLYSYCLIESK